MAIGADSARSGRQNNSFQSRRTVFKGKAFFLGAASVGTVLIFLAEPLNSSFLFGVVGPILVMLVYIFFGLNDFVEGTDSESFADSIYYLGFVLTLVSLSAALVYLRNENPELGPLVSKFGLALLTTIIGLSVRVALVNFKITGSNARKHAEERLSLSVERFADDVELTCDKMEILLNGTVDQVNTTMATLTSVSADATNTIAKATETNAEQINSLFTLVGDRWEAAITDLMSQLDQQVKATTESSINNLERLNDKVQAEIESFDIPEDALSSKLEPALRNLSVSVGRASNELSTNLRNLAAASGGHEKIRQQFKGLGSALEAGAGTLSALQEHANKLKTSYATLTEIGKELSDFHAGIGLAGRSLGQFSAVISQSSSSVAEETKNSRDNFKAMRHELDSNLHLIAKQFGTITKLVQRITEDAQQGQEALGLIQKNLIESSRVIINNLKT